MAWKSFSKSVSESQELRDRSIYFCWELLCLSSEGWSIELLTISGYQHITSTHESWLKGLFPWPPKDKQDLYSNERPFKFNKPTIFFTCRVHPGEVPASHVLNGILTFLLDQNDQSFELRKRYVFKIIPLLNPDGVSRGYWRYDIWG